jgi:spermidine synthase
VGRNLFDMNQSNLSVFVQDGRWGLSHSNKLYDVISVDAYRPPYIPWHMTTVEFFKIAYDRLTNDGVLVINIGRSPLDRTLVNDLGTTISQIFPTIFVMDIPGSYNTILFATKQPGSWENFVINFGYLQEENAHPLLLQAMTSAIYNRQPTPSRTQVYTDDRTPVEWLTNKIVIDFIISGEMEDLQ